MKNLRHLALIVAALGLFASAALAAKPGKVKGAHDAGPAVRLRELMSQLNLTDDQKPKVDQALSELEQKVQDARQEAKGDKEAAKAKVRDAATDARTKIMAVLTKEQKAKLRELTASEKGERKGDKHAATTEPAKQD